MKNRIFILGISGQLGINLKKKLSKKYDCLGFESANLDIRNFKKTEKFIINYQPDFIINASAYTNVDLAEKNKKLANEINHLGVNNIAKISSEINVPLLHFSTDYIFSGKKKKPYKENDSSSPINFYGLSKLLGERAIKNSSKKFIIIRTSWVFSLNGNNFLKTMLSLKNKKKISIISDQRGCPTSVKSLAHLVDYILSQYFKKKVLPWGIYNFSNYPECSWFDFADLIFNISHEINLVEKKPYLDPILTHQYKTLAKRPTYSVLDCSKLFSTFDLMGVNWKSELREYLVSLKKNEFN